MAENANNNIRNDAAEIVCVTGAMSDVDKAMIMGYVNGYRDAKQVSEAQKVTDQKTA